MAAIFHSISFTKTSHLASYEAAPQGSAIWTLPVKENLFLRLENIL